MTLKPLAVALVALTLAACGSMPSKNNNGPKDAMVFAEPELTPPFYALNPFDYDAPPPFEIELQKAAAQPVTKMVVNALLFTQPLDKMQVGLPVLHAKRAWRIHHRPEFKGIGVREDAVVFEDRRNDLRYAALLENPMVPTIGEAR